ncbi:MAG: PA2169 family four-helix-bundle protein [Acidobacteriota bacterium]|nr:PA2169 family four-helix-bundle protein [Acidobacteriota bacterium]
MATTNTNEDAISVLNDLIETNKDGEQGFRTAAESVNNTELKTLFNMYAQQRARFGSELNNEVLRRGGDPAKSGHASAALHRGWIDVKQAITGKSETAVVDECERGEDAAKGNYEDALKKTLPSDLLSLVESQYREVKAAHDKISGMKHSLHRTA